MVRSLSFSYFLSLFHIHTALWKDEKIHLFWCDMKSIHDLGLLNLTCPSYMESESVKGIWLSVSPPLDSTPSPHLPSSVSLSSLCCFAWEREEKKEKRNLFKGKTPRFDPHCCFCFTVHCGSLLCTCSAIACSCRSGTKACEGSCGSLPSQAAWLSCFPAAPDTRLIHLEGISSCFVSKQSISRNFEFYFEQFQEPIHVCTSWWMSHQVTVHRRICAVLKQTGQSWKAW